MTYDLRQLTATVVEETYGLEVEPVFERTDPQHGDFSTNVAMKLAGTIGKPPREIAEGIKAVLETRGDFEITIAGPGFINIRLSDADVFAAALQATKLARPLEGLEIVAEYSDPNPFKVLHAGHLYTSLVGDAIANIIEAAGANVHRVNFGGDVGLHVAKSMWAIIRKLGGEYPEKLGDIPDGQKLVWVSALYVEGNNAYQDDETAKEEIIAINKRVYEIHSTNDHESPFAQIYWAVRQWSYDGFSVLYERLGMKPFEKYYPESATTQLGIDTVKEGLEKGVFQESDGAVVFHGEHKGLHTRVFMNSEGLPTYEAKDLGLSLTKWQDYHFDKSIMITGNEIKEYMKVIIAAVSAFNSEAAERTQHLIHGHIKLAGGVKMSSREGTIVRADDILNAAFEAGKQLAGKDDPDVVLGAVRYSFLRTRIGSDIVYSPAESVSVDGNSGPYIQYALVRARSILRKITDVEPAANVTELDQLERNLARQISMYPEAFALALTDYSPHHITSYLYELAVTFNRFYEQSRVIDDERSAERVALLQAYVNVLQHGLSLLGMPQPEQM
jgi:arginyl-tRNA synthetase